MDRNVTSKPPLHPDETPTPVPITARQPSRGSIDKAEEHRGWCMRTADQLDERASLLARAPGRPDSRMERVARQLRELARRYEAWWTPPPGHAYRSHPVERAEDMADLELWGTEAMELLESHPAP